MGSAEKKLAVSAARQAKRMAKKVREDAFKKDIETRLLEKRTAKEAAREVKREEAAKWAREKFARCGALVANESFGGSRIRLYEKGYVSVSFLKENKPEKIIDITVNADVSKKSGLGRLIVGTATAGMSSAVTSNMRGDIYLAVSTDVTTHLLHVSPPSASSVASARKIEATAKALLLKLGKPSTSNNIASATSSVISDQLEKLANLHRLGALSDEEFRSAKARIIGD